MVKLKIIVRDGNLVLRISEGKQRFYKSVRHLLKGAPNIEKHWNDDKERFTSYAVSYRTTRCWRTLRPITVDKVRIPTEFGCDSFFCTTCFGDTEIFKVV